MFDSLAKAGAKLHIFPPFQKDGRWFGAAKVQVGEETIELMASASESFLREAYKLASNYISYSPTPPGEIAGCSGCSPELGEGNGNGTLLSRLQALAPYVPLENLTELEVAAALLVLRASQGCEACVDLLLTISEQSKGGDESALAARDALNSILTKAEQRKGAATVAGSLSSEEFDAFLWELLNA